ncbi:MAG: Fe-S cluster assembly ATPase SufC [Candidatus Gracilibacteria bacterium]|nr:Fe-S cluster assembly ATPase SufC [Candidatus Gracilibacteria bacterium]
MLELKNLSVSVGEKSVLQGVHLQFQPGKIYFIVGKNGGGKSSMAMSIMGYPNYQVTEGSIWLDGEDITGLDITNRAQKGIFLALQNIPEIPGIKLGEYLRTIYLEKLKRDTPEIKPLMPFVFRRFIVQKLQKLGLSESFLGRDLNVGFSGGEKRRIEMLQIELLNPRYILLDEIDSGLDIDAFKSIANSLAELATPERTLVVVTHNYRMAEFLPPNEVIVVDSGKIIERGSSELLLQVEKVGFTAPAHIHPLI